jgi:hypothetical protein
MLVGRLTPEMFNTDMATLFSVPFSFGTITTPGLDAYKPNWEM